MIPRDWIGGCRGQCVWPVYEPVQCAFLMWTTCDDNSCDSLNVRQERNSLPMNSMPKWSVVSGSREEMGWGVEKTVGEKNRVIKNSACKHCVTTYRQMVVDSFGSFMWIAVSVFYPLSCGIRRHVDASDETGNDIWTHVDPCLLRWMEEGSLQWCIPQP